MKKKKVITIILCLAILAIFIAIGGLILKQKSRLSSEDKETVQQEENEQTSELSEQDGVNQSEISQVQEEAPQESPKIIQKEKASYEKWLAAGMTVAISMHYSDFEITGIYLASETELANAAQSEGAYILFTCGGTQLAVQSKPLSEERAEAGTIDLYTMDLGYATFDEIDAGSVNTENLQKIEMEDLSELINQSILVSLYEH